MRQSPFHFYISAFTFLFLLTGCDSVKQTLGLNRSQPDEFMVVDRPALSIPPNVTLKPPTSVKTGVPRKRHQAQELVLKPPASAYILPSQAESDLLSKAKADQNPADIRTMIEEDAKTNTSAEKGLAEDMVFWKNPKPSGDVIDPIAERERLQNSSSKTSSQNAP